MVRLKPYQKEKYYKDKQLAESLILQDAAEDGHVIHGARAINKQVPAYLRKNTEDYDVFAKNPKLEAIEMEKKLDKAFGGDFFKIKKGASKGTWKVISNVTKSSVVDYTIPRQNFQVREIGANKYRSLRSMKKQINKTLRDESAKFRWEKDREALQRINLAEKNWLWG